ncbi:MAG: hypothetical protein NTZ67_02040 [Gammaproteobacteria bacterium]|nr:hypothetical protein [Gammaproteobacteria bacterium]
MENNIQFQSEKYIRIEWKKLFYEVSSFVFGEKNPVGLINKSGIVMVSNAIFLEKTITIYSKKRAITVMVDSLDFRRISILKDFNFFSINVSLITNSGSSTLYADFIFKIIQAIYKSCLEIYRYTRQHLENRYYDNKSIFKIEIVQSKFSDMIIILNRVSFLIDSNRNKDSVNFILSQLIDVLIILSRLAGARAVLKDNAIDFLFHVRLFQKFIGTC